MTSDQWQQIEALFHAAVKFSPAEREAFLAKACAGNDALRREVEALLAADSSDESVTAMLPTQVIAAGLADAQTEYLIGTQISHYEILSRIGAGGMGEVFLAKDTQLGRRVALKLLPLEFTRNQERIRRFEREARTTSALNHPSILTIYETGQQHNRHFIVTEFIEGQTLRQVLAEGKIELQTILDIVAQIASALAAAHEIGIVHRDIKPENVMVRSDGYVKVLDFGLARVTERNNSDDSFHTVNGVVMGTVRYMSPEQARGQEVDGRSDLFSLGIMLYEMIAGHAPFEGDTNVDVLAAILHDEPAPLAVYSNGIPPVLSSIINKALTKAPQNRYQSASELQRDLKNLSLELELHTQRERLNSEEQIPPPQNNPATQNAPDKVLLSYLKRSPRRLLLIAAAFAVLLILAFAGSRWRRMSDHLESVAVLPLLNQSNNPETEYLSEGLTESLIGKLSRLPNLRVISRNVVMRYKGREIDPVQIGRELNVQAVLTGRLVLRGNDLILSLELVDTTNNRVLWTDKAPRQLANLLQAEESIAQELSLKLQPQLSHAVQLYKNSTESNAAYQAYLKGRYFWNKRTGTDFQKAIEQFNEAIRLDPNYALAFTGLADTYLLLNNHGLLPPQEVHAKARAAATRALQLDDGLAEAWVALGLVKQQADWNIRGAEADSKRATELNPNYAQAWGQLGWNLKYQRRFEEALTAFRRAQQVEPFTMSYYVYKILCLNNLRRYDEALSKARKALELDPNFPTTNIAIGRAYVGLKKYPEALAAFEKAYRLSGNSLSFKQEIAATQALSGNREAALQIIQELKAAQPERNTFAVRIATIYTALGAKDLAFEWLEKGFQERDNWMLDLTVGDEFDALRSDARFNDLLRRAGLPQ